MLSPAHWGGSGVGVVRCGIHLIYICPFTLPPSHEVINMCVSPIWFEPYRLSDGSVSYRFCRSSDPLTLIDSDSGEVFEPFSSGCGKCIECLELHRLQWSHRLLDELKCHDKSCFITLTYAETDGDLHPDHVSKFLHAFRQKVYPIKIRYFYCGEYGSKGHRPHYHMVVFGYDFPDKVPFQKDKKGFLMCRSPLLESLWRDPITKISYGFTSVLPACADTFLYVTKDMQKLSPPVAGKRPAFIRMSLKPGIGANGWDRSLSDGNVYHDGQKCPLPRYYKKLAEREGLNLIPILRQQSEFAANRALVTDYVEKRKKSEEKMKKLQKPIDIIT